MRKVIHDRMSQSWTSAPHVTEVIDVDMTRIVDLREGNKAMWEGAFGVKVTYNDIFVHQVARTIRHYPAVNSRLNGDVIEHLADVNVGVAVNVEGGLMVPVIRHADQKDIGQIARETLDAANRAKTGNLTPDELQGSTFTVSNLGGYGIQMFTPIIDLPNSCILGIGKITKTPVVVEGQVVVRDIVYLSLSFDHRLVDGAPAAEFLALLKQTLENPAVILV
jgi:pyruvate dehydrogenase E2 component (dihydrolipoamide acetyltransferase)